MTSISLADVKNKADELALKIHAPEDLLPTYGHSKDFGYPHIEADSDGLLHYVNVERGQELQRRTTTEVNELLYWIFADVTFLMAVTYEAKNRIQEKDSRRILFAKQEEWLRILNKAWQLEEREKHLRILEKYPFDDLAGLRASYYGQLRQQGYTEIEITKLAYEKYPK